MDYWIYENWTVVAGGRTTIHKGECPYCNHGRGMDKIKDPDRNGGWHGPFNSYSEGKNRASSLRSLVRDCKRCKPHL